jgi:hypothetical protein
MYCWGRRTECKAMLPDAGHRNGRALTHPTSAAWSIAKLLVATGPQAIYFIIFFFVSLSLYYYLSEAEARLNNV